jgi:cytochrome c2
MRFALGVLAVAVWAPFAWPESPDQPAPHVPSAERGRQTLLHRSLNPAIWSTKAYDNLWRQWGLSQKPDNYAAAVEEHYGLHAPLDSSAGLPLGLIESTNFRGKGIVNNCLLCHAGTVAGQTVIGLGNASLDLQSLFDDLAAADGFRYGMPFRFSNVRGTVDPINPATFLLQFRDADLNIQKPIDLGYSQHVCSDPPAWWLIKKKQTRDWTGIIDARSIRVDMVNLLSPANTAAYIKSQESTFADISAFLLTVLPPRYPFPVDQASADRGKPLFVENCAKCHGTYGREASYPNKVVPLGVIGTDRTLVDAMTPRLFENINQTWLAREIGPDGKPIQLNLNHGYQAPPLDGVWATAPYFHNASVPTVYDVLNSAARPKIHTRSYQTGKEEYDPVKLGWKVTVLEKPADASLSGYERRRIYDTGIPGQSNSGHTFGDKLSEAERMAVIEYLKTL